MIFFFRMAGIPFQMKKVSTIYVVYMITVILCSCSSFIGTYFDVYVNWDDLGRAMRTMRILIAMTDLAWIFSCCRYVATLAVTSAVLQK